MAELIRVPEVAAGATTVVLTEWLVKEGTSISPGVPVAVLETDKAQVEVEAETDAVLLRALTAPGSEIAVGSPMALVGTAEEQQADLDAILARLGVESAPAAPAPVRRDVPEPPASGDTPDTVPPAGGQPAGQLADEATTAHPERVFASPLARRMLRTAGIDLATVTGTGPGGRIVRRDAEAAVARAVSAAAAPAGEPPAAPAEPVPPAQQAAPAQRAQAHTAADAGSAEATPHSRLRRAIANRLSASKREVPHFYLRRTVEVDELLRLRTELNANAGVKISVNDLLIKAVALAHEAVPQANVVWTDDALLQYASADVAVAIASERGLVTPVLRGVGSKSVGSLSAEVRDFVRKANDGSLRQHELEGGTITVTNLGMYGVDEFSAIINPPQSMILAVGAIRATPVVRDSGVVPASTMSLVLSVDHRAIDGALAAQWLAALVDLLTRPYRLLV
jgi:pyruvate dehydrogenase E2 component (dihydrolipoamide acetyltransferase)